MGVDGFEGQRRHDRPDAVVLPRDARHGLVGEEVTSQLVGQRRRLGLVALRRRLGVVVQDIALGGIELLIGEPEPACALDFRREKPGGLDWVLSRDCRACDECLVPADDWGALRLRGQERTYRLVCQLVQPQAEHPVDQLILDQRVVRLDGRHRRRWPHVLGDVDTPGRQLRVGDDERVELRARWNVDTRGPEPWIRRRPQIGKRALMLCSTSSGLMSPTTITPSRSGRYQSL